MKTGHQASRVVVPEDKDRHGLLCSNEIILKTFFLKPETKFTVGVLNMKHELNTVKVQNNTYNNNKEDF